MTNLNLNDIKTMDRDDPLAFARARFHVPDGLVYLDGNSLGPMPKAVARAVSEVTEQQWATDLITSWNTHQWIDLPTRIGEKIASLIGAAPGQTVCTDSISVNLFKALSAAMSMQTGRRQILSTRDNFPTDLYIAQGLGQLLGCELVLCEEHELIDRISPDTAVVMVTQVNFRTGALLDAHELTSAAHAQGALVVWDLAHSAGALPVELDQINADFAVGCSYKYLNGGPGAPGFIYVNQRLHELIAQPLSGWMGHAAPFEFDPKYLPAKGIKQMLCGTPPVISMHALDVALDAFDGVSIDSLYRKAQQLTNLFQQLVEQSQLNTQLTLLSPFAADQRGCQLAYQHPHAYAICQALIERNIIGDFRAPDVLRLGFAPLYVRFEDVWNAVQQLTEIVQQKTYLAPRFQVKQAVT